MMKAPLIVRCYAVCCSEIASVEIGTCAPFSFMVLAQATRVAERKRDARSVWINRLKLRRGPNVTAVALANKNARVT
jgi:hypothetical protein